MGHVRAVHDSAADVQDLTAEEAGYLTAAYHAFLARPKSIRQAAKLMPGIALTEGEQAALRDVGLVSGSATARKAERARQDTLHAFFELASTGSLSTQEAAQRLGVAASRVRQRIKARELLAFPVDGEHRIPVIQFHRNALVPGLSEVLRALPAEITPLEFVRWFTTPCAELESATGKPHSPREWLLATGEVAAAVSAAAIA